MIRWALRHRSLTAVAMSVALLLPLGLLLAQGYRFVPPRSRAPRTAHTAGAMMFALPTVPAGLAAVPLAHTPTPLARLAVRGTVRPSGPPQGWRIQAPDAPPDPLSVAPNGPPSPQPSASATASAPPDVGPPQPTATPSSPPDVGTPQPTTTPVPTGTTGPTPTPAPTRPPTPLPPPPTAARPLEEDASLDGVPAGPLGPLSGLPTLPARVLSRPVAVTIDNYWPGARPQRALGAASLLYETLAEGGITRLMAVYLERQPPAVGPVRSTRVYFNEWADGLNAILVHAGGNSDALDQLGRLPGLLSMNLIGAPMYRWQQSGPPFFWRSTEHYAPHNLYTSIPAALAQAKNHHFAVQGHFPVAMAHKGMALPAARPPSGWITIAFSRYAYAVQYRYNPLTNRYKRFMGGLPHVDAVSGQQLAPRNVVVLFAPVRPDPDSTTIDSVLVATQGQGRALMFQDGQVTTGAWQRTGPGGTLHLLGGSGTPLALNPGQTWIEVVPQGKPVNWG